MGISDIRKIFNAEGFSAVEDEFDVLLKNCEREIDTLTRRMEKIRFMKAHILELKKSVGKYSVCDLPGCYYLLEGLAPQINYADMKLMLRNPLFSFCNMGYEFRKNDRGIYEPVQIHLSIRDNITGPAGFNPEDGRLHYEPARRSIYTVVPVTDNEMPMADYESMREFATQNGLKPTDACFAYYVYSLNMENGIVDYYDFYFPLKQDAD